jgi:hypothetical protein
MKTGECYTAANIQIVSSSYYDNDTCDIYQTKNQPTLLIGLVGIVFFFGGIILALWYMRRETNPDAKLFLGLISAYMGVLFLLITPVAYEISLRYFLILIFMPFFFLGLWLKFLGERLQHFGQVLLMVICFVLLVTNIAAIRKDFGALADYAKKPDRVGFDIVYLGEMERISEYLVARSGDAKTVLLGGNKNYLFKSENAIIYLTHRHDVQILALSKNKDLMQTYPTFYLISTKSAVKFMTGLAKEHYASVESKSFGRFTLVSTVPL